MEVKRPGIGSLSNTVSQGWRGRDQGSVLPFQHCVPGMEGRRPELAAGSLNFGNTLIWSTEENTPKPGLFMKYWEIQVFPFRFKSLSFAFSGAGCLKFKSFKNTNPLCGCCLEASVACWLFHTRPRPLPDPTGPRMGPESVPLLLPFLSPGNMSPTPSFISLIYRPSLGAVLICCISS